MPVAIYTRVSTTSQVGGRFDSCESQAAVCRDYLSRHAVEGWREVASYTDAAYSGGNMNRPGIIALKRQIAAGEVKIVLIFKLERVLRSTDEWAPFRSFLQQHGCKLVSTSEDLTEDTPSGRLKNNIMMSVAEYERLNTAEKVRTKMLEQAKRGYWNYGLVPFGYTYDEKKQLLQPEPTEAPLVRRIFEEAARLVSLHEIANKISDEGHRTRKRDWTTRDGQPKTVGGTRIRSDTIRAMLLNPLYAGRVRFQGKEYPGKHEGLVSGELWEKANAVVTHAKPAQRDLFRTTDKHSNLLKGLIHCGHCERALMPSASTLRAEGRRYRYYICSHAQKERAASPCPIRQLPAEPLEKAVVAFISRIASHPDLLKAAVESSRLQRGRDRGPLKVKLSLLDQDLASVNRQIQNCVNLLTENGAVALDEEIRARAGALKEQKQQLLIEHEKLRQELALCDGESLGDERIRRTLHRFGEVFPRLTAPEKKQLIQLCLDRIDVTTKARTEEGARELLLRLVVPVARFVEGMEEQLVIQRQVVGAPMERRALILDLRILLKREGGAVSIVRPFAEEVVSPTPVRLKIEPAQFRHAIHRAREWRILRDKHADLKGPEFAAKVGASVASIDFHFGLLRLEPEIQAFLLRLKDRRSLRFFGMVSLLSLAKESPAKQLRDFKRLREAYDAEAAFSPAVTPAMASVSARASIRQKV